jgi:hypothetical protein
MSKTASTSPREETASPSKFGALVSSAAEKLPAQLHPRRNQHSWFVFRLSLGFLGAALVLLPLALPQSWIAAIFGLALFLTSILLPSVLSTEAAPELEPPRTPRATLILKGADFFSGEPIPSPVQIFAGEEQILAMKPDLQPAVVIPTAEVSAVFIQRLENSWLLVLNWSGNETTFSFRGVFGECNARRAEAAIRTFVRSAPLERAKVRAAGA